jgi:hypothetical protein
MTVGISGPIMKEVMAIILMIVDIMLEIAAITHEMVAIMPWTYHEGGDGYNSDDSGYNASDIGHYA